MTAAGRPDRTVDPGPPTGEERVLGRSDEGRMITGVCAGLGRHTGMDPVIFRVGFALLVVGSGIGIMMYVAAFLLMRNPKGGPGLAEHWSRRSFDTETVLALLAAIFAFGLIVNVAADGISRATIVIGTVLAVAMLAAHSRGADLRGLARSLPERLRRRRSAQPPSAVPAFSAAAPFTAGMAGEPAAYADAPRAAGSNDAPPAGARPAAGPVPPTMTLPMPPVAAHPADAPPAPAAPDRSAPAATSAAAPPDAPPAAASPSDAPPPDAAPSDAPPAAVPPSGARPSDAPPAGAPEYYRRLADLAVEARLAARPRFDSSGEPFAPRGPYGAQVRPYAPPGYEGPPGRDAGAPAPRWPDAPARRTRPRSFVGAATLLLALMVGGIMVATQPSTGTPLPFIGGAVLVVLGAGLLITAWFGRGAGLVATGTVLSLLLVAGSAVGDVPRKVGSYTWEPVDAAAVARTYSVGIGDGTLDLRDTRFAPGSRTRFDASISFGEMRVIVPATARVEVHGYARLGDVQIEHSVRGGHDVRYEKVLEPEVPQAGRVPVIELYVKAGIGDVEVRRAA
ncbi:hypothetical protein Sru01_05740 [Sphaerisporangium rufum]|uniref:PspC domain-containing protein n=1 Tax=Sphaerisporangium rufum TaxID=1381558 RepID=A0A919R253_9ACTN|nr:PspC domain-containing protein [Sphaerisporangium rufum]GII75592.1 hypothetical protein Sru01_05740 [Sphaerisporangium rufum]